MHRTKFPYRLWHWTHSHESLHALSKDELEWFDLLIRKAL